MIEIPAFWAGVFGTLVAEIVLVFIFAAVNSIKNKDKK